MAKTMNRSQDTFTSEDKFDIIGDVHGRAQALEELLDKLGYEKKNGLWQHPSRKALFVGDLIDRGSEVKQTLEIIKAMTDAGSALCIMGNHEYNFIGMFTTGKNGKPLRPHTERTLGQTKTTLESLSTEQERLYWRDWFMTLPLFFENKFIRVIHAAWFEKYLTSLKKIFPQNRLTEDKLEEAFDKTSSLSQALRIILKGPEIKTPENVKVPGFFNSNHETRVIWWKKPDNPTWENATFLRTDIKRPLPEEYFDNIAPYPPDEKPLFFGHYSNPAPKPYIFGTNYTCIDFAAGYPGGKLTAYRFDGEKQLSEDKLVWVEV